MNNVRGQAARDLQTIKDDFKREMEREYEHAINRAYILGLEVAQKLQKEAEDEFKTNDR